MRDISEWYNLLSPLPICFWSRYLYYQLNNDYVSRQITINLLHKAYFSLARNNVLLSMATNLDSTNYEITDVWKHDSLNYFVQSLDTHGIITPWIKANTNCGMCTPWREWMNHQNAWIYKLSVYLQTYNISFMCRNKHDLFMIFCLNICSELISKRHVFVHGSRVWCNHLFTYSRYHFSSCQWEQSENIPQCGLGLLRMCPWNSRQ